MLFDGYLCVDAVWRLCRQWNEKWFNESSWTNELSFTSQQHKKCFSCCCKNTYTHFRFFDTQILCDIFWFRNKSVTHFAGKTGFLLLKLSLGKAKNTGNFFLCRHSKNQWVVLALLYWNLVFDTFSLVIRLGAFDYNKVLSKRKCRATAAPYTFIYFYHFFYFTWKLTHDWKKNSYSSHAFYVFFCVFVFFIFPLIQIMLGGLHSSN